VARNACRARSHEPHTAQGEGRGGEGAEKGKGGGPHTIRGLCGSPPPPDPPTHPPTHDHNPRTFPRKPPHAPCRDMEEKASRSSTPSSSPSEVSPPEMEPSRASTMPKSPPRAPPGTDGGTDSTAPRLKRTAPSLVYTASSALPSAVWPAASALHSRTAPRVRAAHQASDSLSPQTHTDTHTQTHCWQLCAQGRAAASSAEGAPPNQTTNSRNNGGVSRTARGQAAATSRAVCSWRRTAAGGPQTPRAHGPRRCAAGSRPTGWGSSGLPSRRCSKRWTTHQAGVRGRGRGTASRSRFHKPEARGQTACAAGRHCTELNTACGNTTHRRTHPLGGPTGCPQGGGS
jgi:hypothetical protein